MKNKHIITRLVKTIYPYDVQTDLLSLSKLIDTWLQSYGSSAKFDFNFDNDPNFPHGMKFTISTTGEETDEEFDLRIKKEEKWQIEQDNRDREQFKMLSKKFNS